MRKKLPVFIAIAALVLVPIGAFLVRSHLRQNPRGPSKADSLNDLRVSGFYLNLYQQDHDEKLPASFELLSVYADDQSDFERLAREYQYLPLLPGHSDSPLTVFARQTVLLDGMSCRGALANVEAETILPESKFRSVVDELLSSQEIRSAYTPESIAVLESFAADARK